MNLYELANYTCDKLALFDPVTVSARAIRQTDVTPDHFHRAMRERGAFTYAERNGDIICSKDSRTIYHLIETDPPHYAPD